MLADGIGYPAIHIDGYSGLVENLNYNNDRFTGEILQATYTGFANISKDSDTIQNVFVTRDTTMITFDESKKWLLDSELELNYIFTNSNYLTFENIEFKW